MGLMLAEELGGDPLVIEYNARFGDPETEVIIPLLHGNGVDIYDMLYATAAGTIKDFALPTMLNAAAINFVAFGARGVLSVTDTVPGMFTVTIEFPTDRQVLPA